jgi:ABC-type antimicrobial peptide transport system permease subunit
MMPWTTAMLRIVGKDQTWLDDILCSAASTEQIPAAIDHASALLRERHRIALGVDDDFNIRHPEDLARANIKSKRTLELLLFAIASLALLVGGIGIMNVMLASVAQRTTEIGIRAAIGASPVAIQLQFLGEAVMLALLGGGLGVALSSSLASQIEDQLGWELSMSVSTSLGAVAFSVAVGVCFGLVPAIRASRLDPIVALRSE